MSKINFPIDVVIPWVNQDDPVWMANFNSYNYLKKKETQTEDERYRDYGTLKFVLRSIDKYTPWVRNVYLVTDNQVPEWLDEINSKVKVIDHTEIIPHEFLPLFNSSVIEWHVANIKGLSEHFIYLNDDMIFIDKTDPEDFFDENGRIKDTLGLNVIMPIEDFEHIHVNNIKVTNRTFGKKRPSWKTFSDYLM